MRLSMEEVQKQHESTKKLYEQGLRGATASVEQVLDLFDTIEALQTENEQLQELAKAKADGRLVVLPCKVGDTVYLTTHGWVEETKVRTLFFGHPSYSRGSPDPRYCRIRCENLDMPWDSIGKTVFLSREEAEKALEAKRRGGKRDE